MDYKAIFIAEYNRIKPQGANDFDQNRADGLPTWITFSRKYGIERWLDWVTFCGLERSSPKLRARKRGNELTVISHIDFK